MYIAILPTTQTAFLTHFTRWRRIWMLGYCPHWSWWPRLNHFSAFTRPGQHSLNTTSEGLLNESEPNGNAFCPIRRHRYDDVTDRWRPKLLNYAQDLKEATACLLLTPWWGSASLWRSCEPVTEIDSNAPPCCSSAEFCILPAVIPTNSLPALQRIPDWTAACFDRVKRDFAPSVHLFARPPARLKIFQSYITNEEHSIVDHTLCNECDVPLISRGGGGVGMRWNLLSRGGGTGTAAARPFTPLQLCGAPAAISALYAANQVQRSAEI